VAPRNKVPVDLPAVQQNFKINPSHRSVTGQPSSKLDYPEFALEGKDDK
jgi:hypothetical protein